MYNSGILNNFYRELFSTEYAGTDSATQNAKTDLIFELNLDDSNDSFEKWLNGLVDCYANDCDINKTALLRAIYTCAKFRQDMREEFDQVYEDYDVYDDDFDDEE